MLFSPYCLFCIGPISILKNMPGVLMLTDCPPHLPSAPTATDLLGLVMILENIQSSGFPPWLCLTLMDDVGTCGTAPLVLDSMLATLRSCCPSRALQGPAPGGSPGIPAQTVFLSGEMGGGTQVQGLPVGKARRSCLSRVITLIRKPLISLLP